MIDIGWREYLVEHTKFLLSSLPLYLLFNFLSRMIFFFWTLDDWRSVDEHLFIGLNHIVKIRLFSILIDDNLVIFIFFFNMFYYFTNIFSQFITFLDWINLSTSYKYHHIALYRPSLRGLTGIAVAWLTAQSCEMLFWAWVLLYLPSSWTCLSRSSSSTKARPRPKLSNTTTS